MAENQDYELDPLAVEQSAQLINEFGQELKRQQATAEAKEEDYQTEQKALAVQQSHCFAVRQHVQLPCGYTRPV